MDLINVNNIFFTILNYPISHIEFWGTIFGLIAVWLAAKSNILTWPLGLINVTLFFIIFYQIQLYSDMFLQLYFFITGIYGWYIWKKNINTNELPIIQLKNKTRFILLTIIILLTFILGYFIERIHLLLPIIFKHPASYPYIDTFVALLSIVGNLLLARRYIDNWVLWIIVNFISIWMYFKKEVVFISLEYLLFLFIGIYGLISWINKIKHQSGT